MHTTLGDQSFPELAWKALTTVATVSSNQPYAIEILRLIGTNAEVKLIDDQYFASSLQPDL